MITGKWARALTLGTFLAVMAPTLACMGGGDPTEAAAARLEGTWRIWPEKEQARQLIIIEKALNVDSKPGFLKKMKPPASAEETKMYEDINALAKSNPNSPELELQRFMLKMLKDANMVIDSSTITMEIAGQKDTFTYTTISGDDKQVMLSVNEGGGNKTWTIRFDKNAIVVDKGTGDPLRFKPRK